jgi:hypothetical protein
MMNKGRGVALQAGDPGDVLPTTGFIMKFPVE